jgi:putative membrane protein
MMGFGFGGFGIIYMIIFWVVIIAVGIWLLSNLFPRGTGHASSEGAASTQASSDSPREILDRRYARGEITKAEYDEIRRDIGG